MIVYQTTMTELPKSCSECSLECRRPLSVRNSYKILKPYLSKRHPQCPLCEIPDPKQPDTESEGL